MPSVSNPFVKAEVIEAERERIAEDQFKQEFEAIFLGVPIEPCEACGGPRPDASEWLYLPKGKTSDDVPICPKCGMYVDEQGRCIVKLVNDQTASLLIDESDDDSGSLVMCMWSHYDPAEGWH